MKNTGVGVILTSTVEKSMTLTAVEPPEGAPQVWTISTNRFTALEPGAGALAFGPSEAAACTSTGVSSVSLTGLTEIATRGALP